jgi:hypothetical protein
VNRGQHAGHRRRGVADRLGAILRDRATAHGGTPEATIWFGGAQLPEPAAARVNGALSDAAASDDSDIRNTAHEGTTLLSAGLAVGERTGASGRDLLEGMVVGYEAAGRVGEVRQAGRGGVHASQIVTLGGAVAAAKLLKLIGGARRREQPSLPDRRRRLFHVLPRAASSISSRIARARHALLEGGNELGRAGCARLIELGQWRRRLPRDLRDGARQRGDVERQLTERHRLVAASTRADLLCLGAIRAGSDVPVGWRRLRQPAPGACLSVFPGR